MANSTKGLSRRRLDSLKRELERELERAKRDLVRLQPVAVGSVTGWDGSVAEREQADAITSELYTRAEIRCAQINDALDRLQRGTYGTCVVCNEVIPFARLEFVPETKACVTCSALNPWLGD